ERIDAAGRLGSGPSRRLPVGAGYPVERRRAPMPPPPPRGLVTALAVAIVAVLGLVGIAAWPRIFGGRKTAPVTFVTVPKGALIEIEGRNEGTTTDGKIVRELEIGRAYPVVARLDGYEAKEVVVQPASGTNQVTFE